MPFTNVQKEKSYPFTIYRADKLLPRLLGLLGTTEVDPQFGLHIHPCNGIHTFGMKYPVDVLFLDDDGLVVEAKCKLPVNKMTKLVPSAKSVVELPPGSIDRHLIEVGDHLDLDADEEHRIHLDALRNIFHWPINLVITLLWSKFVLMALQNWLDNGSPILLGILIHNTLLLVLFLTRRRSTATSHRLWDWLIPILTLVSAMMLRPHLSVSNLMILFSGIIQCVGLLLIIFSVLSLGRSFGIVPANRKVRLSGAYKIVRHPLYASEMIFYFGFLIGNLTVQNSVFIVLILMGQLFRSVAEENLLSEDPLYRSYIKHVSYRFIPGLF